MQTLLSNKSIHGISGGASNRLLARVSSWCQAISTKRSFLKLSKFFDDSFEPCRGCVNTFIVFEEFVEFFYKFDIIIDKFDIILRFFAKLTGHNNIIILTPSLEAQQQMKIRVKICTNILNDCIITTE